MNKEIQIVRCRYQFGNKFPNTVQDVIEPLCEISDFEPHVTRMYEKGYALTGVETFMPSFNIVVGSTKHGAHAWQLHVLHSQFGDRGIIEYVKRLRNIQLKIDNVPCLGFNNPHTTNPTRRGEDHRNAVWFDTNNLAFFSYNRGALMTLNRVMDATLKLKLGVTNVS